MSGRKRIMVDESEWYRLKREEAKLSQAVRGLPTIVDGVRQQVQADLRQLAERERTLREEITQSRQQARRELRALTDRVDALAEAGEQADAAARTWLADAQATHDLIATTLPHERHAPGELARLHAKLRTAAADVEGGIAGPALGLIQGLYHDLGNLRVDVESADRQRRLAQTTASSGCAYLNELIEHNRQQPVSDERGEPMPGLFLDVDHWSGGQLSALRLAVARTASAVRDETAPMTTEELRRVLDQELPGYEQRLAEVIRYAADRQVASQLRVNLADAVVETLDEVAGYELVDGDYAGRDERAAFYAKLRHRNGNEIVVDVAPAAGDTTATVLRVHSYDHDLTSAAVLDERARAITDGLRARGIAAGAAQEEPVGPDPALRDIEALRRAAPDVPRPQPAAGSTGLTSSAAPAGTTSSAGPADAEAG